MNNPTNEVSGTNRNTLNLATFQTLDQRLHVGILGALGDETQMTRVRKGRKVAEKDAIVRLVFLHPQLSFPSM